MTSNLKKKNNGFTLVELLSVIFIISLLFGLGSYAFSNYIKDSKDKRLEISLNNLKKSGTIYVEENLNKTDWVTDNNKEFTCVSVSALINNGYYDENDLSNIKSYSDNVNEDTYIKVNRDNVSKSIISEEIDDNDVCNQYYVKVPTTALCNNFEYNGLEQELVESNSDDRYSVISNKTAINAGEYSVVFKIDDGYYWDDKTDTNKTIKCSITKRNLLVSVSDKSINELEFVNNSYNRNDINSIITNNVKGDNLVDGHTIKNIDLNINDDEIVASNPLIVDSNNIDVSKNYNCDVTTNLDLIKNNRISVPECLNPEYDDGAELYLIDEVEEGYSVIDNIQSNIGKYVVTLKLDDGYIWNDGNNDEKKLNCEITKKKSITTLESENFEYIKNKSVKVIFSDILVKDKDNDKIKFTDDDISQFVYSSEANCKNNTGAISNNIISKAGTYYGKVKYKGNSIYKDSTSSCVSFKVSEKNNVFTVKYAPGSCGTGTMADTLVTYGVATNLRKYGFKNPGYSFAGWRVKRTSDNGTQYRGKCDGTTGWYLYNKTVKKFIKSKDKYCGKWEWILYKNQASVAKTAAIGKTATMTATCVDNIKPKCSVKKYNKKTTSGVTIKVTCSDGGTGCYKICKSNGKNCTKKDKGYEKLTKSYKKVKATTTYKVWDKKNNSVTCTAKVTKTTQKRKRTCSKKCISCKNSGCSKWGTWKTGSSSKVCCGYTNSSSCHISLKQKKCPKSSSGNTSKKTCSTIGGSYSLGNGYAIVKCTSYTRTCKEYKQSCSSCGCSDWGDWSGWSSSKKCTASKGKVQCDTKYLYS